MSESAERAKKKYEEKRKGQSRIPTIYISEEENELLNNLAEIYGTKKAAILKGLELLAQKAKNNALCRAHDKL